MRHPRKLDSSYAFLPQYPEEEAAYDAVLSRHGGGKRFVGYAQAVSTSKGDWRSSQGLRSIAVRAPYKAAAEHIAHKVYLAEWKRTKSRGEKLVDLHIHLTEV